MIRRREMLAVGRLLLLAWLDACSGSPGTEAYPPAPPWPPAPVPTLPPADQPAPPPAPMPPGPPPVLRDPELARRVALLAGFPRIESSHIGAAGAPSQAFAAFTAVLQVAGAGDLVELLRHPSPVVRGYVARHLVTEVDGIAAALSLLDDGTPVGLIQGCDVSNDATVGGVVADALCWSRLDGALAQIARLAREPGPRSTWAISCVGSRAPGEAAQLALARLQTGTATTPADRPGLLRILGNGGLGEPGCGFHVAASTAAEEDVRVAAAQGLSECASPEGLAALRRLATDASPLVTRIARAELALHVSLPEAERDALLADPTVGHRASGQLTFRLGRPEALARLAERYRTIAIRHPALSWNGVGRLPPSDAATALARSIAAAAPLGTNARRDAMAYLSTNATAADLPELRRSLDSTNVSEVIDAIEALARLRDGASRGAIARLVRHENASVARAATAALR